METETNVTDEQALKIKIIKKQTRSFICPCCKTELQFLVGVQVRNVQLAEKSTEPIERAIVEPVKTEEDILLDRLEESGILAPFLEACGWVSNWTPPNDLRKYFLVFIKNAQRQIHASQLQLQEMVPEAKGFLEAYTFQAITMILADGKYKRFMPNEVYNRHAVAKIGINSGEMERTRFTAQEWRKTRFGYVTNDVFCSALQMESRGSYGRATGSQRT